MYTKIISISNSLLIGNFYYAEVTSVINMTAVVNGYTVHFKVPNHRLMKKIRNGKTIHIEITSISEKKHNMRYEGIVRS